MARTVYDNKMVAHVWAQQTQSEGRSNNGQFYFEGPTIYSYGSHFPIARFVQRGGRKAVLFTTRDYSPTTSRHKSMASSAIPGGVPKFHVTDPTSDDHKANRDEFTARLDKATKHAVRATGWHAERAMELATERATEANAYAEFFGLRWRLKVPTFSASFIAKVKAEAATEAKRKSEATKRAKEKRRLALADAAAKWIQGEGHSLPHDYPDILLRVEGDNVRTSQGATFPVDHGKRAFEHIAKCRANGTGFQRNGHSIHLGHFQIDRIEPNGDVKAGCHFVRWPEIARVAAQLGLTA